MKRTLRRRPWPAAVGVVAVGVGIAYALAGRSIHGPSVFGDELIYMEAARSLAHGGSAMVRDSSYGYGPLYPMVLAPLVRVASSSSVAFTLVKIANALFFASAAAPVYLLARRLLPAGWSAVVATLAIVAPSSLYVGLVFTESLAYATACWALLAMALVLERPTVARQLVGLGAIALAAAVRPQLAVLAPALVLALGVRWALTPRGARPGRRTLSRLWPLGAVVALGAVVLVSVPLTSGSSPVRGLGTYDQLWRSYDLADVARWSWYSLGGLALYLAFVPILVTPATIAALVRSARSGSVQAAAFVSLLLATCVAMLILVGAFSSTSFGGGRLHDRYLFYLVPLWLVVLAVWLHRALPLGAIAGAAGLALVLLSVVALPPGLLVRDGARQLDGVGTALWMEVRELAPGRPGALRLAVVVAALAVVLATALLPGRARALLLLPVVGVFVFDASVVWHLRAVDADRPVFSARTAAQESWVDRAVPVGQSVTTLYVGSGRCATLVRDAFLWTEFFNRRVGTAAYVGGPSTSSVRAHEVHVRSDGAIVTSDGRPLVADVVLAPPGVRLRGRALAEGTTAHLGLWRVGGPVAVAGAGSDRRLLELACPASAAV